MVLRENVYEHLKVLLCILGVDEYDNDDGGV